MSELIIIGVLYVQSLLYVCSQAIQLHICHDLIKPSVNSDIQENCTLLCGLYIHRVLSHGIQEVALCTRDEFTPLVCERDGDCYQHHRGSYCKKMNCICEASGGHDRFLPRPPSNFLDICVVHSNWLHPNTELVSFPWKTVLAVFGTLGLVVIIFMGFKWTYPLVRTFRDRNGRHRSNNEQGTLSDDNVAYPLYPNAPQYRLSSRSVHHGNPDKPPSYETLVQLLDPPPRYEETTNTLNNLPPTEENIQTEANVVPGQQQTENESEAANTIAKQ